VTSHFKLACGAVAILSLVTVFALGRSPSPPDPETVVAAEAEPPLPPINEAYRDIALEVLRQSGRDGRIVKTETIVEPPPPVPPPLAKVVEATVKEQKLAESNICTRNGMKKTWISRFKWRCRKI